MFTIKSKDKKARIGEIKTAHGNIQTPFFMPVATKGSIKYISVDEAKSLGYQCLISNGLVNYFRPGLEIIKKAGGLHRFIGWDRSITTDSGGFQLLSESFMIKTTWEGALFKNPFDGKKELITPEKLMDIQMTLGSDIAMVLDDVCHYGTTHEDIMNSMAKTHDWAKRCKSHHKGDQLLFGIVQGGIYKDLREKSAEVITSLDFDGYALGGLAIGEPTSKMFDVIEHTLPLLPEDKPRYLMGVGSPVDMIKSIRDGVDMFDSTFPTSNARHNTLFTFQGKVRLKNSKYKDDLRPIEEGCRCFTCQNHSRAFVHHLLRFKEPTGKKLATIHNIHFMNELMKRTREAIEEQRFDQFAGDFISIFD